MKKHSNSEITINGKTWIHCDCCGRWHKSDYGINIDFNAPSSSLSGRIAMCGKCAKKFSSKVFEFDKTIESFKGSSEKIDYSKDEKQDFIENQFKSIRWN